MRLLLARAAGLRADHDGRLVAETDPLEQRGARLVLLVGRTLAEATNRPVVPDIKRGPASVPRGLRPPQGPRTRPTGTTGQDKELPKPGLPKDEEASPARSALMTKRTSTSNRPGRAQRTARTCAFRAPSRGEEIAPTIRELLAYTTSLARKGTVQVTRA